MAKKETGIGWCDYTCNLYGWCCTKISPACKHCYMFATAERRGKPNPADVWYTRFEAALRELRSLPSGVSVFLNDMSDTYHEKASAAEIRQVHQVAVDHPDKTFVICTKRPERAGMKALRLPWPDNLWLMVTVESDAYLWRITDALLTGAQHVAVSAEPLLGSLTQLEKYLEIDDPLGYYGDIPGAQRVEWIIDGSESGLHWRERPASEHWFRHNREVCLRNGVAYFHKQGSAFKPGQNRLLDGRTWEQVPDGYQLAKLSRLTGSSVRQEAAHGYQRIQL